MVGTGIAGVGIIGRVPHNVSLGLLCSSRFARRNSVMKIDLFKQIALLCAAGLFVALLLATYGLDLSPAFF
jgi:hypothetical protein